MSEVPEYVLDNLHREPLYENASGDTATVALMECVQIRFSMPPSADLAETLRREGWRWSKACRCWYMEKSPETAAVTLAERHIRLAG